MKKSTFTDEQMVYTLRQVEMGTPVGEVCRKLGISEQTCTQRVPGCKKRCAGMGVAKLRWLRQLEEENRKLKHLVADLTLDKHMLQSAPKNAKAGPETRICAVSAARLSHK